MTKKSPTARAYVERIPRVWVGPLAPAVLPQCSSWLKGQGYSSGSAAGIVNLLARLSIWMAEQGADVEDISPELLERFMHWERSRQVVAVGVTTCMAAMRRFLTAAGYLTTHGPDIAMIENDKSIWPRCDGLIWPHPWSCFSWVLPGVISLGGVGLGSIT